MKNLDNLLYRIFLKTNLALLVITFLLYPFRRSLSLGFIDSKLLITLMISLLSFLLFAIIISIYNIKFAKRLVFPNISYYLLYHIIFPIIHKLFSSQNKGYEKFSTLLIDYNNRIQRKQIKKYKKDEVLILLPHCLQYMDCPYKITNDINNCKECGNCVIQDFKKIHQDYGIQIKVATGGTLARKIISDLKPKVILAVACHRDLTEGIKDVEVIPVVGFLNERPNGPCFNTSCDVNEIKNTLEKIL